MNPWVSSDESFDDRAMEYDDDDYPEEELDYCPECGAVLYDLYSCGRCWWQWAPPDLTLRERVQHLLWWVAGMRYWPRRVRQWTHYRRDTQDLPF